MNYSYYENKPGIEIVFSDGSSLLSLYYVIYEWQSAQIFYHLIQESIDNRVPLYSDTSFNINNKDETRLINEINLHINLINKKYNSKMKLINDASDLNSLHQNSAINADCNLWRVINDRIHAYEQFLSQKDSEPRMNAYFRFETDKTIDLKKTDYLFFTADRNFGDLCLNYTYKGKHWLEIQSDNDFEAINDGQLQPETRISPTGYMLFRPPSPSPYYRLNKFVEWFERNCSNNDITPEMALGYLLVGKLVMPDGWNDVYVPERTHWTKDLSAYKTIIDVKTTVIKDVKNILKRSKMI